MKKQCSNCAFWERSGADGICRESSPAPSIMRKGFEYTLVWARTEAQEWCGKFEEVEEE